MMLFCRLQLHGQLSHQPFQFGDPFFLLALPFATCKQLRSTFNEFLLPARENRILDPVFPTDLGAALDAGQYFQYHLGLELG